MNQTFWFGNECLDHDHVNDFEGIVSGFHGRQNTTRLIPKFEGEGYPTAEQDEQDEQNELIDRELETYLDELFGWVPEPDQRLS